MSVSFSQKVNQSPIQENSAPAKNVDCCVISMVALIVIVAIGALVAGITLTTLGAVTVNPVFLDIGISLILLSIIMGIKIGCGLMCRS